MAYDSFTPSPLKALLTCTTMLGGLFMGFNGLAAKNAYANPQGGQVVAGSATIAPDGSTLNIHQHSNRAVIDWRSFNIGAGEHTQFHQPSSNAIVLNRVRDTNPSHILGKLSANGQVVLVNPNGVVFGKGSVVDVNGLIATTADIRNQDFMDGKLRFTIPGNPDARIENHGHITAKDAGLVGLVAPHVINNGVIEARMGRVHLASGDMVTVDLYGDGLMEIQVSDAVSSQLVRNTGTIKAEGGTIALTAAAGHHLVNSLIDVKGELKAPSISQKGGKIIIAAEGRNAVRNNDKTAKNKKQGNATVHIEAALDVSGKQHDAKGGAITITGDHIAVLGNSHLDASGVGGGGFIHIGGAYLGGGTTPTADRTIIQSPVFIDASAIGRGDGGEVIIWADYRTDFSGTIHARGGHLAGNGGFVETSGKIFLNASGFVDASAANGLAGTYLLDPANVTIQAAGPDSNITGSPDFTTTDDSAIITTASIEAILNQGTNVSIRTGDSPGGEYGDIFVNDAITKTAGGDAQLTLSAYRSIFVDADISSTHSALSVVMLADNSGIGDGSIHVRAGRTITSNDGDITLQAGSIGNAAGTMDDSNAIYIEGALYAGAGNITLTGVSAHNTGISLDANSVLATTTGDIRLTGISDSWGYGIYAYDAEIMTQGGNIFLSNSNHNGSGSAGIYLQDVRVETQGSGNIRIEAENTNDSIYHLSFSGQNTSILTQDGAIDLVLDSNISNTGMLTYDTIFRSFGNGDITFHVTHGNATSNNSSTAINLGNGSIVQSGGGNIAITSINHATDGSNIRGIDLNNAIIRTSGAGAITLTGIGQSNNSQRPAAIRVLYNSILESGTGDIKLDARYGYLEVNYGAEITTGGIGNITLRSENDVAKGIIVNNSTITAHDGSITMDGTAGTYNNDDNTGITLNNSLIEATGNGHIAMTGRGGSDGYSQYGIKMDNGNIVRTKDGNITLEGYGGTYNGGSYTLAGIWLGNYATTIETTGKGNIDITGWGGHDLDPAQGGYAHGIAIQGMNNGGILASGTGNINLTGIGGSSSLMNSGILMENNSADDMRIHANSGNIGLYAQSGTGSNSYGLSLVAYDTGKNSVTTGNAGNITISTDILHMNNSGAFASAGDITVQHIQSNAAIGVGDHATGDLLVDDNALASLTWGKSLVIGNAATGNIVIDSDHVFAGQARFVTGAYGDITLNGDLVSSMGNGTSFVLASGRHFHNNAGSNAIRTTGGTARYLVYSTDPLLNSGALLASDFIRYSCHYNGACAPLPAHGSGLLYAIADPAPPPPKVTEAIEKTISNVTRSASDNVAAQQNALTARTDAFAQSGTGTSVSYLVDINSGLLVTAVPGQVELDPSIEQQYRLKKIELEN